MSEKQSYTVKQLSKIAGISARTLRFYDKIGLLQPVRLAGNGYRCYSEQELLRLQQILYYREMGLSLKEIRTILNEPDFNILEALELHRQALGKRQKQLDLLISTVDRTISYLRGNTTMESKELFSGFSEEQQKRYEGEIQEKYGIEKLDESRQRWGSYSAEEKQRILQEGGEIYRQIASAMPFGPASQQAQIGITRWHQYLRYFYEPTTEIILGLADMYNDQPEFAAFFERIHPDLNVFMREAIRIYCQDR